MGRLKWITGVDEENYFVMQMANSGSTSISTDPNRRTTTTLTLDSKLSLHDVRNEYLILPNPPSQSTSLLSSAEHHPLSRPIEINPKTGNRSEMKTKQKKY